MALLVYGWIKAVSPGPVLFRQTRVGRGGVPFTIFKFRSMKVMAETSSHEAYTERLIRSNQPMTKLDLAGDPRLIKGGCLIRMSGLDELPQLLNVLRGEMSLVGPRPCMPNEFALYNKNQMGRFRVAPGLTGLWQVKRADSTTFREMVALDELYVDRLSPALDLKIVLETPGALIRQLRACVTASVSWCRLPRKKGGQHTPGPHQHVPLRTIPRSSFESGMNETQTVG